MTIDWVSAIAPRMREAKGSEIRELLKLLDQPDIISFAGGIPDPDLFPRDALAAASQRVLGDPRSAARPAILGERGLCPPEGVAGRLYGPPGRRLLGREHHHHQRLAAGARLPRQAVHHAGRYRAGGLAHLSGGAAGLQLLRAALRRAARPRQQPHHRKAIAMVVPRRSSAMSCRNSRTRPAPRSTRQGARRCSTRPRRSTCC